jgi:hypothetical protein
MYIYDHDWRSTLRKYSGGLFKSSVFLRISALEFILSEAEGW